MNLEAQQAKIIWPNHEPVCGTDIVITERNNQTLTHRVRIQIYRYISVEFLLKIY